jgi:DHA2 family multidrug resistance protein
MDCFHLIGVVTLIAAPLVLLTKHFAIGGGAPSGH